MRRSFDLIRADPVYRVHPQEGKKALIVFRRPDLAADQVAGAQTETLDLGRRDVYVIGTGKVVEVG